VPGNVVRAKKPHRSTIVCGERPHLDLGAFDPNEVLRKL